MPEYNAWGYMIPDPPDAFEHDTDHLPSVRCVTCRQTLPSERLALTEDGHVIVATQHGRAHACSISDGYRV